MARKKILLVDDSATVLLMEKMLLGKGAYDIITAGDGEEGVAKAKSEKPDAILMDVVMPKADGFEALRRIKSEPSTKAIPVIMVTTKAEEERVKAAFDLGCSGYLTKPIDGPQLLGLLRELLGG